MLHRRTGSPTIPQVFLGGQHLGGATELFDAIRDGSARSLLQAAGVSYDHDANLDPYTLLPKWLQPRKSA